MVALRLRWGLLLHRDQRRVGPRSEVSSQHSGARDVRPSGDLLSVVDGPSRPSGHLRGHARGLDPKLPTHVPGRLARHQRVRASGSVRTIEERRASGVQDRRWLRVFIALCCWATQPTWLRRPRATTLELAQRSVRSRLTPRPVCTCRYRALRAANASGRPHSPARACPSDHDEPPMAPMRRWHRPRLTTAILVASACGGSTGTHHGGSSSAACSAAVGGHDPSALLAALTAARLAGQGAEGCATTAALAAFCDNTCAAADFSGPSARSPGPICLYKCWKYRVIAITASPIQPTTGGSTVELHVTLTAADGSSDSDNESVRIGSGRPSTGSANRPTVMVEATTSS